MSHSQLSALEVIRREKLQQLIMHNINPFPAEAFLVNKFSKSLVSLFLDNLENPQFINQNFRLAGRIMSNNDKGKIIFLKIQDKQGLIQLYLKRDDLISTTNPNYWEIITKNAMDIGDIIGVEGFMFITKTGEPTLHVTKFDLLTKSLKPIPVIKKDEEGQIHDEVSDPDFRYRQRYVDLIIHAQVKDVFIKRTKMVNFMRNYLNEFGALEVETPVLQPIPGGALAKPFVTHHNALDRSFYLRISNELYLKKLIVGGFDWVYEFSRDFRNEGMDRTHNPEFTILEWYTAYKDYFWMMEITEQLLSDLVFHLHNTFNITVGEHTINFKPPFKRISFFDAISEKTGCDISNFSEKELISLCEKYHIEHQKNMAIPKYLDLIFGALVEKSLIQPCFVIDYPISMSPLTKKHRSKPNLVERFELMICGKEIANAYSELNDPIDQRLRFEEQVQQKNAGNDEAMYIDYDFLRALEYGMPPTSGIGIGIDRLAMLLMNQPSIQDVLFFPQMRNEQPS
ncbi:MAG: lysine--tRNA ligase [Sediminibacterium sp.]|nr:lysine--tRNA ligase [Sediminibacterium sp.]